MVDRRIISSKTKMRLFIASLTEEQSAIVEGLIDDNVDVWLESYQDEPPEDWSPGKTQQMVDNLIVIKDRFTYTTRI